MLTRYPQLTQILTSTSVPISTPPLNTFLLVYPVPWSVWSIEPTSPDRTTKSPPKVSWSTKPSRQSVFKQIYGSQEGKVHQHSRASKAQSVLGLNSGSNVQGIHLLENSGRSKNFSYNLQSANPSRNKTKLRPPMEENWTGVRERC